MSEVFPQTYESWKKCITVACGIPLTKEYAEDIVKILSDDSSPETKRFLERYGTEWKERVLSYFSFALKSL